MLKRMHHETAPATFSSRKRCTGIFLMPKTMGAAIRPPQMNLTPKNTAHPYRARIRSIRLAGWRRAGNLCSNASPQRRPRKKRRYRLPVRRIRQPSSRHAMKITVREPSFQPEAQQFRPQKKYLLQSSDIHTGQEEPKELYVRSLYLSLYLNCMTLTP